VRAPEASTPVVQFIDSHAHLADAAFDSDRDAVVEAARVAGALAIVCIGASHHDAGVALALAARYPTSVQSTAGVHPHDASTYDAARDLEWIRASLDAGAVAVGECGLDYHYDHAPRDRQRVAFLDQLSLARETGRPVVVHTRDAEADTLAMVRDAGRDGIRGVLHSYTGGPGLAEAAVEAGWWVSFSGIVTFRNWTGDDVVRAIPAERILVETDAPYLTPVPVRGRRNEPRYIPHIVERLAVVRGTSIEIVGSQLTANARTFFSLP